MKFFLVKTIFENEDEKMRDGMRVHKRQKMASSQSKKQKK